MKRICLSLVLLASLTATADARLSWRSPRSVVLRQRLVVRPWVLPAQPVRRTLRTVGQCVGGACHR